MCLVFGHGSARLGIVATDTLWRTIRDDGTYEDEYRGDKLVALPQGWAVTRGCGHFGRAGLRALQTAPASASARDLGARIRQVREAEGPKIRARYPESPISETDFVTVHATDHGFEAIQFTAEGGVKPGKTILGTPPAGLRPDTVPDLALHQAIADRFLPLWRAARSVGDHVRAVAAAFAFASGRTDGMSGDLHAGIMQALPDGDAGSVSLLAPAPEVAQAGDDEIERLFEPGRHLCAVA